MCPSTILSPLGHASPFMLWPLLAFPARPSRALVPGLSEGALPSLPWVLHTVISLCPEGSCCPDSVA